MTTNTAQTIAIIGGGCSGAMLTLQLARQWPGSALRIVLIEPSGRFGPGVAYSTRCPRHLLNVPAGNMSALPDDPDHFVRWAAQRDLALRPESFAPRMWYGDYLAALVDEASSITAPRVQLERVTGRATEIHPTSHGARLVLDDGREFLADRVVLAVGHFPPAPGPAGPATAAAQGPGFIANPWAAGGIDDVRPEDDVLIVGTGLTAVDVVLELHSRGHVGRIHAVSRRGLLPQAHRAHGQQHALAPAPEVLNAERTVSGMLRGVRAAVRRAEREGCDWRDVIAALRPVTAALWGSLSMAERARFLRHLQPFWDTHRHRAAPEADAAIRLLREHGRLIIHRGRLDAGRSLDHPAEVRIRPRGAAQSYALAVDRVINCTGPTCDPRSTKDPLIAGLLRDGLVTPDPLGLGLQTADNGASLTRGGGASDWLFIIGPPRKAQLWESTAVRELRNQAGDLAGYLWGSCRPLRAAV